MFTTTKRLLVVVALLASAACAGNKNNPSETIPTYAGNWGGTYSTTSCSQSGQMGTLLAFCSSWPNGTILNDQFEFTQTSRTVSGQFYLGTLQFPIAPSTIATDGSLTVSGTSRNDSASVQATWTLHRSGAAFTGSVAMTWSSTGLTGTGQLNGSTTGVVTPRSASLARLPAPLSLKDMTDRFVAP